MQADDLPAALRLTQAQRWSHQSCDWQLHFRLGHGWVACDGAGTVVGTILWWSYGANLGSVGLVIVDSQQQGHGIGRQLMDVVIAAAGPRDANDAYGRTVARAWCRWRARFRYGFTGLWLSA